MQFVCGSVGTEIGLRQGFAVVLGAASQCLGSILQRSKVQVRGNILTRLSYRRPSWIEGRLEHALIQLLVALANCFLLVGQQLLQLLVVFLNGVCEVDKVERQHVSICEPQHRCAYGLGQRPAVHERGIREMRVPVKVVVNRVVDTLVILSPVTEINAGNPQIVEERGVVGP